MAWPTPPNAGDIIEDTLMDAIIDALALWGGHVSAGGWGLTNLSDLSMTSGTDTTAHITTSGSGQSVRLRLTSKQSGSDSEWNIVAGGSGLGSSGPDLRFVIGTWTNSPILRIDPSKLILQTANDPVISAISTGTVQSAMVQLIAKQATVDDEWNIIACGNALSNSAVRVTRGSFTNTALAEFVYSGSGGTSGWFKLNNSAAAPVTGSASGGGCLFVESGALKFRGSSGTLTTIAPA
jgi:hypothetical protein